MNYELTGDFPWGVLLVTDSRSTEPIPSWASRTEAVAAAASALVVRVQHADEGPVHVRVVGISPVASGELVFEGYLAIESGLLRVSDALGDNALEIPMSPGNHAIRVHSNSRAAATEVDLVLDDPGHLP